TNQPGQENADDSANCGQGNRLSQKLFQDVGATGAERFAKSNLLSALSHGNQHDIHNHDRADYESNARHCNRYNENRSKDAIAQAGDRVRRDDAKVVLLVKWNLAPDAHEKAHFLDGVAELVIALCGCDKIERTLTNQRAKIYGVCFQWHDNEIILGDSEHGASCGLDPDDPI